MINPQRAKIDLQIRRNREEKAIAFASEILTAAHLLSVPVDPLTLAAQESPQLVVKSGNFKDSFDGLLEYLPAQDRFILYFNSKYDSSLGMHHPRTRFSIAHELGHFYLDSHRAYLMGGGQSHPSRSGFLVDALVEREADAFAAGLLMPERLFKPRVNESELSMARIKELASIFETSLLTTAIRSVFCSHFPCEIVGVQNASVVWRFSSKSLFEAGCYPLPKGRLKSPNALDRWDTLVTGNKNLEESTARPTDWFASYGPATRTFTVWEEYMAIEPMDLLLILLTVSENELFESDDEEC